MKKRLQAFCLFLLVISLVVSGNLGGVAAQAADNGVYLQDTENLPGDTVQDDPVQDDPPQENPVQSQDAYDAISLVAIEDYSYSSLTLSWFSDGNNDGFIIYRKSKYDKGYKRLGFVQNIPYSTHYFEDSSFRPGITFTYRIVAYRVNASGEITEGQKVSESVRVAIPKPVISSASRSGSRITLKWKKAGGVDGYQIFRKTGGNAFEKAATVSSGNMVSRTVDGLSSTKVVKFKIRSFVRYGGEYIYGPFSNVEIVHSAAIQKVINKFKKLQKQYPSGKYWNHVNRYSYSSTTVTNKPCRHISLDDISTCNHYYCPNGILGYQCYGFAWKMSDLIYGRNAKIKNFTSFKKCKMGDVIRYKGHSAIITEKHKNYVVVGECNYGNTCMILWGRRVHKSELKGAKYSRRYR